MRPRSPARTPERNAAAAAASIRNGQQIVIFPGDEHFAVEVLRRLGADERRIPTLLGLPEAEDEKTERFIEEWGRFSWYETGSMPGGGFWWTLGLITSELIAEIEEADESEPRVSLRRGHPEDRVAEIAGWLEGINDDRIDVPMLAAECLIGDLEHEVYASYVTDVGSDTLSCSIHLAIAEDEVEAFLGLLAHSPGGRDAIDAVRRPESDAGIRRAERIRRYEEDT
jgi:hypothetical protein